MRKNKQHTVKQVRDVHGRFAKVKRRSGHMGHNTRIQREAQLTEMYICELEDEIIALRGNVGQLQTKINRYRNALRSLTLVHGAAKKQIQLDSDFKHIIRRYWDNIYWQVVDIINKAQATGRKIEMKPETPRDRIMRELEEMKRDWR